MSGLLGTGAQRPVESPAFDIEHVDVTVLFSDL